MQLLSQEYLKTLPSDELLHRLRQVNRSLIESTVLAFCPALSDMPPAGLDENMLDHAEHEQAEQPTSEDRIFAPSVAG
jgi:hypothetical protein